MKCKDCNIELLGYVNGEGAYGVPSYPYESGYYCPNCSKSWSNLEIADGRHLKGWKSPAEREKALRKYLKTPKDIAYESNENKASTLALHFIGYIAKPIGISDKLYKKCLEAFNNNRGKCELEIEAILKILEDKDEAT